MWNVVSKSSGHCSPNPTLWVSYHIINGNMIMWNCLSFFPVWRCHLSLMGMFCSLCPPNKKGGVGRLRRGLPGWLSGKVSACQCRRHGRCGSCSILGVLGSWVWSLGLEDPLEEEMATQSNILPWKNPMDWGVWPAIVHGIAKSHTVLNFWVGMHGGVNFKQLFRETIKHEKEYWESRREVSMEEKVSYLNKTTHYTIHINIY